MNEGIEAMIHHCLQQFIPDGWHISRSEEVPLEGEVAPIFLTSRLTAQGWEPCAVKVVAMFQVETRPLHAGEEGQGTYRLCLLENGKMQMAEGMLRLPPPSKLDTAFTLEGDRNATGWGCITPGYEREDPLYDEKHLSWSMIGDETEQEPERYTLRQWRIKAKMSRTDLADAAGVSYTDMTRAELVDYKPVARDVAERILTALRERFEAHPKLAEWMKIPEKLEEVKGLLLKEEAHE